MNAFFVYSRTALRSSAVLLSSLLLFGCAGTPAPRAGSSVNLQQTLTISCAALTAIHSSQIPLNRIQGAAVNALALVCPPNPTPTTSTVVLEDLLNAYAILSPLLGGRL
jgi:hypothetical protein